MALRNQPYLPLYVQDFLTDEKLIECSAQSTGVYIRIMCIMHKSEYYGKILLRQIDKQTEQQILNFATKLVKHLPYTIEIIITSLKELIELQVLQIDGDFLFQKRMVKDGDISVKRSLSGKIGGDITKNKSNFAQAKGKAKHIANTQANSENEIENVIVNNNKVVFEKFRKLYGGTKRGLEVEFDNFTKKTKDWKGVLPKLKTLYLAQEKIRTDNIKAGGFVPQYKNLQTYINQRAWEEEIQIIKSQNNGQIPFKDEENKPRKALIQ